jgi:hypothetical protein
MGKDEVHTTPDVSLSPVRWAAVNHHWSVLLVACNEFTTLGKGIGCIPKESTISPFCRDRENKHRLKIQVLPCFI